MTRHAGTRRRFLATLPVVALAGCTDAGDPSGDADPGGSPPPDGTPTPADGAGTPNGTATPGPGETPTAAPDDTPTPGDTPSPTPDETPSPVDTPTPNGTRTPVHPGYETTEVRVTTPDGELLGSVTAAIADTGDLRYTGLSDTDSLPEDRGMLFVYDTVDDRTFVMREMDFGIDIVYADDRGVITTIHHAEAPGPDEDGNQQRYPGRGQYVLEVNYDWTTRRGVEAGDVLQFEL